METKLADRIRLAPSPWPEGKPEVADPSDLNLFVPSGLGMDAPMIFLPYDRLEDLVNRPSYYGFTEPSAHPFRNAPVNDEPGGVIYLKGALTRDELKSLISLMGVWDLSPDYAAFWLKSSNVMADRYVEQLRIVSKGAIESLFRAPTQNVGADLLRQILSVEEALWAFVEDQQQRYSRETGALRGLMGGDGDWAKERLAFGLMVENASWGICRIWSRAWLITK